MLYQAGLTAAPTVASRFARKLHTAVVSDRSASTLGDHSRNEEVNQTVTKDQLHDLALLPAAVARERELPPGQHEHGKVEGHGVDERGSEKLVVRVRDCAALAGDPCCLDIDTYRHS